MTSKMATGSNVKRYELDLSLLLVFCNTSVCMNLVEYEADKVTPSVISSYIAGTRIIFSRNLSEI